MMKNLFKITCLVSQLFPSIDKEKSRGSYQQPSLEDLINRRVGKYHVIIGGPIIGQQEEKYSSITIDFLYIRLALFNRHPGLGTEILGTFMNDLRIHHVKV